MKNESLDKTETRLSLQEALDSHVAYMLLGIRFYTKGSREETESTFRKYLKEYAELYASQLQPIREKPDFEKLADQYCESFTYRPRQEFIKGMERIWKDYVEPIPGK
jgi:hypothetical protein